MIHIAFVNYGQANQIKMTWRIEDGQSEHEGSHKGGNKKQWVHVEVESVSWTQQEERMQKQLEWIDRRGCWARKLMNENQTVCAQLNSYPSLQIPKNLKLDLQQFKTWGFELFIHWQVHSDIILLRTSLGPKSFQHLDEHDQHRKYLL